MLNINMEGIKISQMNTESWKIKWLSWNNTLVWIKADKMIGEIEYIVILFYNESNRNKETNE